MTENRIRITIVIKNAADLAFIERAGGGSGRGAKQAGVDKLLAFAQVMPETFERFLNPSDPFVIEPDDWTKAAQSMRNFGEAAKRAGVALNECREEIVEVSKCDK